MIGIQQYPKFAPVAIEHRQEFLSFLAAERPEVSEMGFASVYAWRDSFSSEVSILDGLLVIRTKGPDGSVYHFPPIGKGDKVAVCERLFTDGCKAIAGVTEPLVSTLRQKGFVVEPDNDNWDYVYSSEDLANLPGTRYHRRRKDITKFEKSGKAASARMDSTHIKECKKLGIDWCMEHRDSENPIVASECAALQRALSEMDDLHLFGIVATLGGEICAFAIAEEMNPDMAATHFEKADAKRQGAFQFVNREFARSVSGRFRWVNREQDLGLPGLRENKRSYHPHHMVEKYIVRAPQG